MNQGVTPWMNKELNISQLASAYNGVLLHSMSGRQDDAMLFLCMLHRAGH